MNKCLLHSIVFFIILFCLELIMIYFMTIPYGEFLRIYPLFIVFLIVINLAGSYWIYKYESK